MFDFDYKKIISGIVTTVTITTTYRHYSTPTENIVIVDETNPTSNNQVTNNKSKNYGRGPASTNKNGQRSGSDNNAIVKSSAFNQADFNNLPLSSSDAGASGNGGAGNTSVDNSGISSLLNGGYAAPPSSVNQAPKVPANPSTNFPETGKKTTNPTFTTTDSPKSVKNPIATTSNSSAPPTTGAPEVNKCISDTTSGAFSNPIGVKITCTAQSNIKYCVGIAADASGCCDPLASGSLDYSSQVVLGQTTGSFCLSFYGESASAGDSVVYQQVYTFNTTLPDLNVVHHQLFYQSTQMYNPNTVSTADFINSFTKVHSADFGKPHFGIGQINFKENDPIGDSLGCEQIVTEYSSLYPSAQSNLSFLDVSLNLPTQQLQIPLLFNNMNYGDNNIFTYMENRTYVDVSSIYACQNAVIKLEDFDYFQADQLAFSAPDISSVREFTGAFSPYGFFEDPATPNGISGLTTKDQTGQKLEYGMFGSIY